LRFGLVLHIAASEIEPRSIAEDVVERATGWDIRAVPADRHHQFHLVVELAGHRRIGRVHAVAHHGVGRLGKKRALGTDKLGVSFLAVGFIAAQVIMSRGEVDDWFGSPVIQGLGWLSAAALLLFVGWQLSRRNSIPLLRLELIKNRNLIASLFLGVFAGVILSGSIYALPEFLPAAAPKAPPVVRARSEQIETFLQSERALTLCLRARFTPTCYSTL